MDTETIKYYDKSAESYLDKVCNTYPDSDLLSFINSIKSGGTVLDLGCGPGNSSAMMQSAGLNVQASDCSQKMVDIAKNKFNVDAIKNFQKSIYMMAYGLTFLCFMRQGLKCYQI